MIYTIDLQFLNKPKSIAAFAIQDDNGFTLVESGPFSTHENLLAGLEREGIAIEEIHTLLLSHIHFDHAGAAWWWAERGVQVYVHPRGLKHMIDPTRLYESARQIYGDRMEELWGEMRGIEEGSITAVGDYEAIMIGNRKWVAHHTPGHASHHIAWQLGESVFTGDVGGCRIGNGPVVPPCPPPDIDAKAWHQSLGRLKSLGANHLYLTHYGAVTGGVEAHLNEVGDRLDAYVKWMEPHYRQGTSVQEVMPLFQQFYTQELQEAGVGEEDLESYLAANPPFMSVTGLLRWLNVRDKR